MEMKIDLEEDKFVKDICKGKKLFNTSAEECLRRFKENMKKGTKK